MLLRFRVANHRSIRDEAELSLVSTRLRSATPPEGDWKAEVLRIVGIYGPNASGKSTVLDAIDFLCGAVRHSATRWAGRSGFPYYPFVLDSKYRSEPSQYEIDLVVQGVRYAFGFKSNSDGIQEEWLYTYPTNRRRVLYERVGDDYRFGRSLGGENVRLSRFAGPNSLFLSSAANNKHPLLGRVQHQIVRHIKFARFREDDKSARIQWVARLIGDDLVRDAVAKLLGLADFGINGLRVEDPEEVPEEVKEAVRTFLRSLSSLDPSFPVPSEQVVAAAGRTLRFLHGPDASDESQYLPLSDESSGTVAWLALAVPAFEALRRGEVFMVDEIDSSLHPVLTAALIDMFRSEDVNARGAQLIFTSHDTSLLGNLHATTPLRPEEVWLTEKDSAGATALYSLAEFPIRARDNLERRYLQGRYGAVPVIAQEKMRAHLATKAAQPK